MGHPSLQDQTHQPLGSWAWSPTRGKRAPKDTWTVVGGRVHRNPPTEQRPTPHPGSLLKNSLEMCEGLKKANDIKIVFSGSGERKV